MKADLTDVTLIVDRSGSMETCRVEAETGINHFVDEQKKHPGQCLFSLLQFDTEYEFAHKGVAIAEVPPFKLVPRGMTALLDAVGRAINETGDRLAKMNESDRPGLVVFVIVTDGCENASHEFNKPQIKEMIERQQTQYQWQFIFLGANQDAFAEAAGMGVQASGTLQYSGSKSAQAYGATASNVRQMRTSRSSGQVVNSCFTESQRSSAK